MKHHKTFVALLAVAAMVLPAVIASPATAEEEPQGPVALEDPVAEGQPARGSQDGNQGAPVARTATSDAGILALPAPPSGIPAPPSDVGRPFSRVQPRLMATSCHYLSVADNPHISANLQDVSVHGWWLYYNGDCETATVRVWLYHYRCILDTEECSWVFTAYGEATSVPRNAPLHLRANARHPCESQARRVGFQVVVDVDIDDLSDPSDTATRIENVYCVPW